MTATTTQSEYPEAAFDAFADADALLDRLHSAVDLRSPIVVGERIAALLISKNSDEIAAMNWNDEVALAMFGQLDQALDNLQARVGILENAMLRMAFWAKATATKGNKNGQD